MTSHTHVFQILSFAVQVHSRPAVFTALAVLERLGHRLEEEGGDWGVVLDRLARALLVVDKVSGELGVRICLIPHSSASCTVLVRHAPCPGQPLLVMAALDPVAHLLAREVVTR